MRDRPYLKEQLCNTPAARLTLCRRETPRHRLWKHPIVSHRSISAYLSLLQTISHRPRCSRTFCLSSASRLLAEQHSPSSQTHTVPGRIMDRSCPVNRLVTRGTNPNLTASRMWILHRGQHCAARIADSTAWHVTATPPPATAPRGTADAKCASGEAGTRRRDLCVCGCLGHGLTHRQAISERR